MVRVLPSLLTKYAPDASRIAQIVTIPQFMNLEVYVDLRMKKAYEQLLDDIARMYTRHTSLSVLYHAARTLHAASQAESLSSSNEARMPTLMEEVVKGMKEACEGMVSFDIMPEVRGGKSGGTHEIRFLKVVCFWFLTTTR